MDEGGGEGLGFHQAKRQVRSQASRGIAERSAGPFVVFGSGDKLCWGPGPGSRSRVGGVTKA